MPILKLLEEFAKYVSYDYMDEEYFYQYNGTKEDFKALFEAHQPESINSEFNIQCTDGSWYIRHNKPELI